MKELVIAGRAFLVGDVVADTVVDYTAVLARARTADVIELRAFTDGRSVEVSVVLSAATPVFAQTSPSAFPEPDNADMVHYMRDAIRRLSPDPFDYVMVPFADSEG
jgi:hypothetical protein